MSNFRADCSRCCGICCVAPGQLAEQGFGSNKPAGTPCNHLNGLQRCTIYSTRQVHGYSACGGFDCFGAGQWITQSLFGGASWAHSPELAEKMFAAYRHWYPRFESAALIEAALPHVRDECRRSLVELMNALTSGETASHRIPADAARLRRDTIATIRSALKGHDEDA
jgi:hypothetical protein